MARFRLLDHLHTKVGLIGTNQNLIGEESLTAHRTTPESYEVQELLREMADAGCTHVVMEASSHALVLHRLEVSLLMNPIYNGRRYI